MKVRTGKAVRAFFMFVYGNFPVLRLIEESAFNHFRTSTNVKLWLK